MIRRNIRANVFFVCGCIFTMVGAVFLIVSLTLLSGIPYLATHNQRIAAMLPFLFILIGGVTALIGILLLRSHFRKVRNRRRLIERGDYVNAEIMAVPVDYAVTVNRWPTFRIECRYVDPITCVAHFFISENLLLDPASHIIPPTVRVYVDRNSNYLNYYVDVDSIFP